MNVAGTWHWSIMSSTLSGVAVRLASKRGWLSFKGHELIANVPRVQAVLLRPLESLQLADHATFLVADHV